LQLRYLYPINEITARQPIPDRYLEHIFALLRRGGLIQSQRGAKGGYVLAREPWQITMLEVIMLMDGDRKERDCGDKLSMERELVREVWQQASSASQKILSQYTLQELCQRCDVRKQKQPMYYI
jgi:Rrf2 family protein